VKNLIENIEVRFANYGLDQMRKLPVLFCPR
jgi:hypothetical protein